MKTILLLGTLSSFSATGLIYSQNEKNYFENYIKCISEEKGNVNFENIFFNKNCLEELKNGVDAAKKKEVKPVFNDINEIIKTNPKNEKELKKIINQLNKKQNKYMNDYYDKIKSIKDVYLDM